MTPGGGELHPDNPDLRKSIAGFLHSQTPRERSTATRLTNQLSRSRLTTVRDVLAAGKFKVVDIEKVGRGGVTTLENLLAELGFTWQEIPEMSYITQIFDRPENVPLVVALGRQVADFATLHELLLATEAELAEKLTRPKPGTFDYEPDFDAIHSTVRQAWAFIDKFDEARERS